MSLRKILYKIIPKNWRNTLGSSSVLKPLRDLFFRKSGVYREEIVKVDRNYLDYKVQFKFVASLQIAIKAFERGIENTLITNGIKLLKKYKPEQNESYTVFDVGANFGYLSLVWNQTISKNGSIYAFEPHPIIYNSLQKSVHLNNISNLHLINKAVGDKEGEMKLHLSNTTSNTLKEVATKSKATKKVTIEVISIDEFMSTKPNLTIDLLKIDVDGIELKILKGAKNTILKYKPIIIVENNDDYGIHLFLRELDYKIFDMNLIECIDDVLLPENSFAIPQ